MKAQCPAIKANGERCQRSVEGQSGFCWAHTPENAGQRKIIAARGGRGGGKKRLQEIQVSLQALIDRVDEGDLDPAKANTMIRGYDSIRAAIKEEREFYLVDEIVPRLEAVEDERRTGT